MEGWDGGEGVTGPVPVGGQSENEGKEAKQEEKTGEGAGARQRLNQRGVGEKKRGEDARLEYGAMSLSILF